MLPRTFIFFGRSGSGKGTQAELLIKWLKAQDASRQTLYIQTGQQGRDFAKQNNLSARLIRDIIDQGKLFPAFIPIYFWTKIFVENIREGTEHIILDGLCRRPEEAPILDGALQFYKREKPTIVVINVSEEWAMQRLVERKRSDDVPSDIKNRLDWYTAQVIPAVDYFRNHSQYQVLDINGEQSIDAVHQDLLKKANLT